MLNGPNLGRLGIREPEVYGTATLADLAETCRATGRELDLQVEVRQTDDEAEMIRWVHEAADARTPIVLNPAAFTHYSYALHDALAMRTAPLIEVHLSNPAAQTFRHTSVVAQRGRWHRGRLRPLSYQLALQAVAELINAREYARWIVLVGFMGAGKTTVGRLLSGQLGRARFIDADAAIEERAGCPVPQIFEDRGEQAFRVSSTRPSPRGSAALRWCSPSAAARWSTREPAACCSPWTWFYLHVRYAGAVARVGGDDGRPMPAPARPGGPLPSAWWAAYEAVATHTVLTDGREPADVCRDIVHALGAAVPRRAR